MLTYRLVNNLKLAQDSEWQELAQEILGPGTHPSRQKGFCLGREALRECLMVLSIDLKISQLKLREHKELTEFPDFTISLSHSKDWGAAVVANKKEYVSVGIDIEDQDRVVKDSILERISHPDDALLPAIHKWSLKEAAFKALMNTGGFLRPVEFSSLLISEKSWSHPSTKISGEWKIEIQNGLVLALAWIRTRSE